MDSRKRTTVDILLYAIADPEWCNGRPLDELSRNAAAGGASLIQYRDKSDDVRAMIKRSREITKAIEGSGVPFIVNDRVDVALAVDAAGVHLGQEDMPAADARKILGDEAIIGLSIKTTEEAQSAPLEILDYVFVGGVFPTSSKNNPSAIGVSGWKRLAEIIRGRDPEIPVGAIAGIDESNIEEIVSAGADGVAIISAIFMADDVEKASRVLRQRAVQAKTR